MTIVVADTSPICYLILIEQIDVLSSLYGRVIIPSFVKDELSNTIAPLPVQSWIKNAPNWLKVREVLSQPDIAVAKAVRGNNWEGFGFQTLH